VELVSGAGVEEVPRFMVGRSGSSAGVLPVFVDAVVVGSVPAVVLSGLRRFMVGRSGSSAGVDVVLVVEGGSLVPVEEPELSRRFMVGRSGSPAVEGLVVVDVVVASGLLLV
jgi:hypothetical protein